MRNGKEGGERAFAAACCKLRKRFGVAGASGPENMNTMNPTARTRARRMVIGFVRRSARGECSIIAISED